MMARGLRAVALVAAMLCMTSLAARAESTRGMWTVSQIHGRLQLELSWHDESGHHDNEHSSYVDAQQLGIAGALASSGQHVTFPLHREAGDYAFEGWVGNGEGSGQYTFTPNDAYFDTLRKRGYNVATMDYKMAFANLDITMSYIDDMERLGYKGDVNNLIAMKAVGVTPDYVHQLQSAGVTDLTEQQTISLRAVGVDPSYINELASVGFSRLSANQLVTLRALKVDAAYVNYLRNHGFKNLTVNQVVEMKAERI